MSESQSLSAGQTTTLSCSVSQPADLPGTAVLAWNKDGSPLSGGLLQTLSLGGFFRGFTEIVRALECSVLDLITPLVINTPNLSHDPGGSTRTEDTARTLTLVLKSLTLSQTGNYRCTATYPGVPGALETEDVSLFVRGWVTPLGQHHVVDGSSEALTCVVQTEAEPVVTWWVKTCNGYSS